MTFHGIRFALFAAFCALAAGCGPAARAHVTSRSVSAVSSGGSEEVWIVMSETGVEVIDKDGAWVTNDGYAVYRCIPVGCKRIGELKGTEAFERTHAARRSR